MYRRNRLPLAIVFLVFLSIPSSGFAKDTVRFISVLDGDSMLIEFEGRSQQVRLIGIDAPERGQEYGDQARAFAMQRCFGKTVQLEFDVKRKDRFGRLLAYVYCNGNMVNETLVREGLALAVTYKPNTKHQKKLEQAQSLAKRNRAGFWLRGGLKQTPYEWRRQHKR